MLVQSLPPSPITVFKNTPERGGVVFNFLFATIGVHANMFLSYQTFVLLLIVCCNLLLVL